MFVNIKVQLGMRLSTKKRKTTFANFINLIKCLSLILNELAVAVASHVIDRVMSIFRNSAGADRS